jgi:hypothetical protein
MKRILPLLVVSIFILSGFGTVATPEEEIESLNVEEDWELVIDIKGGLFGYNVRIVNEGNETVNGSLTMNITTDATFMILGGFTEIEIPPEDIEPGEEITVKSGSVIGFGPIITNIAGVFETPDVYPFETEANGFLLLFFPLVSFSPVVIP